MLSQLLTPSDSVVFLQLVETVFFNKDIDDGQAHSSTLIKYFKVSLQMDNSAAKDDPGNLGHLLPLKKDWLLNPLFFIWDLDDQI